MGQDDQRERLQLVQLDSPPLCHHRMPESLRLVYNITSLPTSILPFLVCSRET